MMNHILILSVFISTATSLVAGEDLPLPYNLIEKELGTGYDKYVRVVECLGREVIILGETHAHPKAVELRDILYSYALDKELVYISEGWVREPETESFLAFLNKKKDSLVYGLEDPILRLIGSASGARRELLGYNQALVNHREGIWEQFLFAPAAKEIWQDVVKGRFEQAPKTRQLIEATDAQLTAFRNKIKSTSSTEEAAQLTGRTGKLAHQKASKDTWMDLYSIIGLAALKKTPYVDEQVRQLVRWYLTDTDLMEYLDSEFWVEYDIFTRDRNFVRNIVELIPSLPPGKPIVVTLGKDHLNGVVKGLQEVQHTCR